MTVTIFDAALNYVMTQLAAAGAPAPAYRSRTEAFTAAQMPAFQVYPARCNPYDALDTVGTVTQRFGFTVVGMVSAASEADVALDPLLAWVWKQVLSDPTLGGLALYTELESCEWAFPPADSDLATCSLTFSAYLSMLRGDPTASGLQT